MRRFKFTYWLTCVALLSAMFGGLLLHSIAQALPETLAKPASIAPNQTSPTEKITLTCQYPSISTYAGSYFSYTVDLQYIGGKEPRVFDLQAKVPDGFTSSITPSYGSSSQIAAIRLDPSKTYPDSITVTATPLSWQAAQPGEYPITVAVSSGDIKASINLKAIVTAKYDLQLKTSTGLLNTNATSGDDNYLTISVINTGTADLEKIGFSSKTSAPSGWSITFDPKEIDILSVGDTRDVQVDIKPAKKSISGDYMVTISAQPQAKNAFGSFDLRVTVLTPTIWGWVGVAIVVLVIAGLAYMFMRLGRR
ncbi:MAG: NEW3 domain-containing protein [Dehalococcoidia bacterium]